MLKKHHASSEKLREVFYEKDCVLDTAIDKISKCRREVVEKVGFAPSFVLQQKTERFMPRFDLFEDENVFHVDIELPGLAAADIKVTVTGEWIRVSGKRGKLSDNGKTLFLEQLEGDFSRTLHLDNPIDGVNCSANIARGLLHVTLPKVDPDTVKTDEFSISVKEK